MASTCLDKLSLHAGTRNFTYAATTSSPRPVQANVGPLSNSLKHSNVDANLGSLASTSNFKAKESRPRTSRRCRVVAAATAAESDPYAGVEVYKPASYDALVKDAARTVEFALGNGLKRMEVEFPPLPSSISSYKGSSDEFIDANLQLALALARRLRETRPISIKLVVPDMPERRRAARILKSALDLVGGVSLGTLDDVPGGGTKGFFGSIRNVLDFDFSEGGNDDSWTAADPVDLYLVLNASTAELPAVERYLEHFAPDAPAILFNLELDTLRADLGLLGFPPKDTHYRFLTTFTPVFYIRMRDYSKSVPTAPFILNYSGALLRQYPGPWQVMLKQGDGSYACVAEDSQRFNLGQVKEELLISLGLQEEEGSTLAFLRRGYKATTWWEEDLAPEKSTAWRS